MSELFARIESITSVTPQIAPAIAARGAVRSAERSGVRVCKASKIAATTTREPATTQGLREATDKTIAVTK
jgi:hypothetical protein